VLWLKDPLASESILNALRHTISLFFLFWSLGTIRAIPPRRESCLNVDIGIVVFFSYLSSVVGPSNNIPLW